MIEISFNGSHMALDSERNVAELLQQLCIAHRGVAVAINRCIAPRSTWLSHVVQNGDVVEVVSAAAGG